MSDATPQDDRTLVLAETWRQEKAVVFARDVIIGPHMFIAYDRAKASGSKSHLWQWKRGVRKGTLDTQTILPNRALWFEFKRHGEKVSDDDDQGRMIASLREMGHAATWGVTIMDLWRFYLQEGVPMVANAEYRALVLDGLVDSRIAKAQGRVAPGKKKARAPRREPRSTASRGFQRRAAGKGILLP